MARTKAHERYPKKVYGKQVHRGNLGETKARKMLERDGYKVSFTSTHPHGKCDLVAKKGNQVRNIQVKRISSRTFASSAACRNRMSGKPYNIKRITKDMELWVFDKGGHIYKYGVKTNK